MGTLPSMSWWARLWGMAGVTQQLSLQGTGMQLSRTTSTLCLLWRLWGLRQAWTPRPQKITGRPSAPLHPRSQTTMEPLRPCQPTTALTA